jgi:4-hydroxy-3-methylbut-2-enyl diphosphate reductase
MEVIIPAHSGFCPGVKTAEQKVFETKRARPGQTLYVEGFLINNKIFIAYLERNGIQTVESVEDIPAGSVVFIRTHGLNRHDEAVHRRTYDLIDLTCVNVKKVQKEIARRTEQGFVTVIVGTRDHPEIRGLVSYADGRHLVLENETDLEALAGTPVDGRKIFLCSQTTGSRVLFETVRRRLEEMVGTDHPERLQVYDSICPVTERKEEEALCLQRETDISFVIGDKLSSNAKKLHQRLAAAKRGVYFVEDLEELKSLELPLEQFRKALVVSSASTPDFIEREVTAYLSSIKPSG